MEKININKRLRKISAYILDSKKIIDIGCDHALLGIYVCLNNANIEVIASDINDKPLIKAKDNIQKYHLEDRIKVKLGDGLDTIENDVDTIVISGMGTMNMLKILNKINEYPYVSNLVLSPNNDFDLLRSEIQKLGFKIEKEEIIKDNNKYYLIIKFTKGKELIDNFFGKLNLDNDINRDYFKYIYEKNNEIIEKIGVNDEKKKELININKRINEKVDLQ